MTDTGPAAPPAGEGVIRDHGDVIEVLGGRAPVAEALKEAPPTVGMWKTRRSIPPRHWPAIARLGQSQGRNGITVELLEKLSGAAA